MKERLQKILIEYNLNSSKLADKLGVQRSGISHIMAGRNKPSYDFLKGILELFPDIDANWLITGKGSMFKEDKYDEGADETGETHKNSADLFNRSNTETPENTDSSEIKGDAKKDDYKSKQDEIDPDSVESIILLLKSGKFRTFERE